jgi:crotonobetainyl-CoA:carnitine CoA-transferase CaiB-like acyl-CoA transferase
VLHEGIVQHLQATPGAITFPAPSLGEHTEQLLEELLGLSDTEIRALHDEGVLQ